MNDRDWVYVVYMYNDGEKPIIVVFDNEEAAYKCRAYNAEKFRHVYWNRYPVLEKYGR